MDQQEKPGGILIPHKAGSAANRWYSYTATTPQVPHRDAHARRSPPFLGAPSYFSGRFPPLLPHYIWFLPLHSHRSPTLQARELVRWAYLNTPSFATFALFYRPSPPSGGLTFKFRRASLASVLGKLSTARQNSAPTGQPKSSKHTNIQQHRRAQCSG